ncbi:hypothetical protein Q5P01_023643 [Channa striata]|uniref:Uncharacterized protein n=1 Tax=Channa striata TaxID=64152 RepID=A0AA88LKF6_CHASR|nr:hypothetical protein Q5P01_023643 [Channa striata]
MVVLIFQATMMQSEQLGAEADEGRQPTPKALALRLLTSWSVRGVFRQGNCFALSICSNQIVTVVDGGK